MNEFVAQLVIWFTNILYIAILGRVIISWLNVSPTNPFVTVLYQVTEPLLGPIRRVMPRMGMLDLSPIVAILLLTLVRRLFIAAL